jgi:hypothetical protein
MMQVAMQPVCNVKRETGVVETTWYAAHVLVWFMVAGFRLKCLGMRYICLTELPAWYHYRCEWHAGEVSAGVLTHSGKSYIVVVGQHPTNDVKNGVTMIYDMAAKVCSETHETVEVAPLYGFELDA